MATTFRYESVLIKQDDSKEVTVLVYDDAHPTEQTNLTIEFPSTATGQQIITKIKQMAAVVGGLDRQ